MDQNHAQRIRFNTLSIYTENFISHVTNNDSHRRNQIMSRAFLNPSNAKATLVQSARMQRFLKTI